MRLKTSPHDMPEKGQPLPPLLRLSRRQRVVRWLNFGAGLAAFVLGGWLTGFAPETRPTIGAWGIVSWLLTCAFTLLAGYYFSIGVHELGHWLAGRWVGFRCFLFQIGFMQWRRTANGWRLIYSGTLGLNVGGLVLSVPDHPLEREELRRKMLIFLGGGPLATALQVGVISLIWFSIPDGVIGFFGQIFFTLATVMPLVMLPGNLIPISTPTFANDGAKMLLLAQRSPEGERLLLFNGLLSKLLLGLPPSSWENGLLAEALALKDNSQQTLTALLYAYMLALEQENIEAAASYLDDALQLVATIAPQKRYPHVLWEAAVFELEYGGDLETARGWMAEAAKSRVRNALPEFAFSRYYAQTAVAAAAENWEEVHRSGWRARHAVEKSYFWHSTAKSRAWLDETLAQLPAELPPQRPASILREVTLPILGSASLVLLVSVMLAFLFLGVLQS